MADQPEKKRKRRGGPGAGAPAGGDQPQADSKDNKARRGGGDREPRRDRDEGEELDERVVDIKRVAKVIKGGRRFAFRTVVIVGDNKGRVGVGVGKARGVPDSIRKGADHARRNMLNVSITGTTIPHPIIAEYGGAKVLLRPAAPGTGVIAGGGVRAVLEAAGVHDVLSKSQGSPNLLNVAMATLSALRQLRTPQEVATIRGKDRDALLPEWEKRKKTNG